MTQQDTSRIVTLDASAVPSSRNYQSPLIDGPGIVLTRPQPVMLLVTCTAAVSAQANTPATAGAVLGSPEGSGQASSPVDSGLAGIRLTYGIGASVRHVLMDLRAGTYQLPPCDSAKAELIAYRDGASTFSLRRTGLSFVPGFIHPTPTRPTVTAGFVNAAAVASLNLRVPPQARWFDMWADINSGWTPGGADAPVLDTTVVAGALNGFPRVLRDYINKVQLPSWGPVEIASPPNTVVQVGQTSAACDTGLTFWTRFWLEL